MGHYGTVHRSLLGLRALLGDLGWQSLGFKPENLKSSQITSDLASTTRPHFPHLVKNMDLRFSHFVDSLVYWASSRDLLHAKELLAAACEVPRWKSVSGLIVRS